MRDTTKSNIISLYLLAALFSISTINADTTLLFNQKINIDPADINTMISLRLFIKQMSKKTTAITTAIANKPELNSLDLVATYEGVPIRTRHYDRAGNLTYEETLNSVSQEKISMNKILIPANYTQQKMQ